MKKKAFDLWVGMFIIFGILSLLFLSLKTSNMSLVSFQKNYTVSTKFDNIGGLKLRAPVKSSGVVVGRIKKIYFDNQNYQAVVHINLEKKYQFSKDTCAKILTSGILGEQYISLESGIDENFLKDGDVLTHTQSAIVFENLISQFLYSKASELSKKQF